MWGRKKRKGRRSGWRTSDTSVVKEALTADGLVPATTVPRSGRSALTPKPRSKEPFVKTAGRSSIDDVFERVREAQAGRSSQSTRPAKQKAAPKQNAQKERSRAAPTARHRLAVFD